MTEIVRAVLAVPDRGSAVDLPVQLTSFVGRDAELIEVEKLLAENRLVTLAGPGGCGKTRLAVAAAEASAERWPDGVRWADLGPLTDPELVARAVAAAARVLVNPAGDPRQALVAQLRNGRLLLCLDTCEHLLESCAELVELVLRGCPGVSVLATSREPRGVPGEVVWRVPPLRRNLQVLARHCADVGRDYDEIEKTMGTRLVEGESGEEFARRAAVSASWGIEHLVVVISAPWTPERLLPLAEAVPALADVRPTDARTAG